jgi:hypothetical protein
MPLRTLPTGRKLLKVSRTPSIERAHVAMVNIPPLQADVFRQELDETFDFRLDFVWDQTVDALPAGAMRDIDVLILGTESIKPTVICDLLESNPRLKTVAIAPSGRRSVLCRLIPDAVVLSDMSPASLVAAVREALSSCDDLLSARKEVEALWEEES